MRLCTKCGLEQPYSEFYKRSNGYYQSGCRTCRKKIGARRYSEHKEEMLGYTKEWYEKNPEARKNHKEAHQERNPQYNKEYMKEYMKRDYAKKARNKRRREYRKLYPEKTRHSERVGETRRRAAHRRAVPSWLSEEQKDYISKLYRFRRNVSGVVGREYHVDHIIPLRGKNICGLHVPWNLKIIPAKENLVKGNSWS